MKLLINVNQLTLINLFSIGPNDIKLNKNVKFSLNIESLKKLVNMPEYNKPRYLSKNPEDQVILNSIEQIKAEVSEQLEQIINNTQGSFSDPNDLIEGMVLKMKDTGNQYRNILKRI